MKRGHFRFHPKTTFQPGGFPGADPVSHSPQPSLHVFASEQYWTPIVGLNQEQTVLCFLTEPVQEVSFPSEGSEAILSRGRFVAGVVIKNWPFHWEEAAPRWLQLLDILYLESQSLIIK